MKEHEGTVSVALRKTICSLLRTKKGGSPLSYHTYLIGYKKGASVFVFVKCEPLGSACRPAD
jgi:hypothetical protein